MNEWDGSSKLFNNSVKGIWEGSQWASRVGSYKPRTVLLCNANATPKSISFDAGVKSKVCTNNVSFLHSTWLPGAVPQPLYQVVFIPLNYIPGVC